MNETKQGYLLLLLPVIGWGFAPNIVDIGLDYIDALPFLTLRFMVSALIMTPFVAWKKREEVRVLLKNPWTWIIGLSQTWAIVFQYLSQLFIPPSLSAIIAYSYMILVPLVSVVVLREELDARHIPIVVIAVAGLVMITTEGNLDIFDNSGIGMFLAFLSTWGFAFYITSTARIARDYNDVDSVALFYLIMVTVTVAGLFLSIVTGASLLETDIPAWVSILLLAIVSTIGAYIANIESLRYIAPNSASVFLLLQIVIPFVMDFFWFNRIYSWWVLTGSVLIFSASLLAVRHHEH